MGTPKKSWSNSMFSQLPHIENNKSLKRKKYKDVSETAKRATRKKSNSFQITQNKKAEEETSMTGFEVSTENWIDFFAPTCSEDLALHPRKLQEIQQWFQHCVAMKHRNPAQMCLLTGPSGSGKTAAVRTLAKENNFTIQEWINPVDKELFYNLGDQSIGQSFISSQVDVFKNFLFEASRYPSLLKPNSANKSLLMVEDFPNFVLRNPTVFQEILGDYVNYAKSPLIFIVTDARTRDLNISHNIFSDQIRQKFLINHINLNAVASTIMQKSMKRFCTLMRLPTHCQMYKPPTTEIIDSIIISAQGDVRNALINLHFCSLKGAPNLLTKYIGNDGVQTSKKRKSEYKLKSLGRDESITMMHALGRVFNPKFTEHERFVHSPEELAEDFSTEPKKFIDLVQANYIPRFRDTEYLLEASDGLSLCDVLLNEYRDDSLALIGLNVGIRSVMVANKKPVTGWMPIKGQKRIDENKTKMLPRTCQTLPKDHILSSNLYTLDYKTFLNIISP